MNQMRVSLFLDGQGFGPSVTYALVASSAHEAATFITDHLNRDHPWGQIDIDVLAGESAEGPPCIHGLVRGDDGKDVEKARR